ncbi:MAG TPA: chromate resistance protein ChrB domain-containing protein [Candidatus Dormibacteraeota bacterium]|nr:chromate resistance protein ChrB domain-containing protein [Candidatus Dormibacteraeota bacterium]
MKWIAREKIKVDRVACPWLIKKFIGPPTRSTSPARL